VCDCLNFDYLLVIEFVVINEVKVLERFDALSLPYFEYE